MTKQLSWDTLEKVISNADNWLTSSLTLFTDETCDLDEIGCYALSLSLRRHLNTIFYGHSTWSGDLDNFAFDIYDVRTDNKMNAKKIVENIKAIALKLAADKSDQELKDIRLNGLYIDVYCGWKTFLESLH